MHFAAGHRILGLDGAGAKCRNIHGHTFDVTWEFFQPDGPMTLEFGALKEGLRDLVKHHWDHGFFVDEDDDFVDYLTAQSLKHFPTPGPPTTELIARIIAESTMKLFPFTLLHSVHLKEGPENAATWSPAETPAIASGWPSKSLGSV
jgi:6-pyruvoyltetrahydropterin/6-carboxytetrahydropterin synthase